MSEMTQYQKRLLIADAGGIAGCRCGGPACQPPDYFNSRDACMEVILGLNAIKRQDFIHALVMIVSPASQWHDMHLPELFNFLTATPEQLCEALGSTLNLW